MLRQRCRALPGCKHLPAVRVRKGRGSNRGRRLLHELHLHALVCHMQRQKGKACAAAHDKMIGLYNPRLSSTLLLARSKRKHSRILPVFPPNSLFTFSICLAHVQFDLDQNVRPNDASRDRPLRRWSHWQLPLCLYGRLWLAPRAPADQRRGRWLGQKGWLLLRVRLGLGRWHVINDE